MDKKKIYNKLKQSNGFFKKAIIMLFIFCLFAGLFNCVFTSKLSEKEYLRIRYFYNEMKCVNPDLKSDFYVEHLLKCLDRDKILTSMKKDALIYSLTVTENAFDLLMDNKTYSYVSSYLERCYLPFSEIVSLSFAESLIVNAQDYFRVGTDSEDVLEVYSNTFNEIVEPIQKEVTVESRKGIIGDLIVLVLYFVIVLAWYVFDKKVVEEETKNGKTMSFKERVKFLIDRIWYSKILISIRDELRRK